MNLEELEKQVTYLEDIQEIENLQKIYGYYFDNHKFKELLGLFSENFESVEITDHGKSVHDDAGHRSFLSRFP